LSLLLVLSLDVKLQNLNRKKGPTTKATKPQHCPPEGTMWPTYFIMRITKLFSSFGRLEILYENYLQVLQRFLENVYSLRGKVLPGVSNALTPPKIGRISPWLFNNLQKLLIFLVATGGIHLLITFLIDECAKTSKENH